VGELLAAERMFYDTLAPLAQLLDIDHLVRSPPRVPYCRCL
jgi:hypothetical protein